jgi:hypothetical protein
MTNFSFLNQTCLTVDVMFYLGKRLSFEGALHQELSTLVF